MEQKKVFNMKNAYDVIALNGHAYMLADSRIDRSTIPPCLYSYEIRDRNWDEDCFTRIVERADINAVQVETVLGKHPLPLDETGSYCPEYGSDEYEDTNWFGAMTFEEYIEADEGEIGIDASAKKIKERNICRKGYIYTAVVEYISNDILDLKKIYDVVKGTLSMYGCELISTNAVLCEKEERLKVVFTLLCKEDMRRKPMLDFFKEGVMESVETEKVQIYSHCESGNT